MRLIDADEIVEIAEHAYGEWNKGMAAAEGRKINRCFKMQELCKAVKGVADDCLTIDPESLRPTAKWIEAPDEGADGSWEACSRCAWESRWAASKYKYCPHCGARMVNADE